MRIALSSIDALYWTLGGLFALSLFKIEGVSWLPVVIYSIPFIIGSAIIMKLKIKKFKKLLSQLFLLCAGMILATFAFIDKVNFAPLFIILISSFFLSLAEPLNMAAFSDLLDRMGKEKEHLIAIKKTGGSCAYLIAPVIGGFLADEYGYSVTFTLLGLATVVVAAILIIITPKKIRLPISQIEKAS